MHAVLEASTLEEINADNENGRVQKMTTIGSFVKAIFAGGIENQV